MKIWIGPKSVYPTGSVTLIPNDSCWLLKRSPFPQGWVEPNGRYFIMDMWTTNYLNPILEPSQDIADMSGALVDGFATLK